MVTAKRSVSSLKMDGENKNVVNSVGEKGNKTLSYTKFSLLVLFIALFIVKGNLADFWQKL